MIESSHRNAVVLYKNSDISTEGEQHSHAV